MFNFKPLAIAYAVISTSLLYSCSQKGEQSSHSDNVTSTEEKAIFKFEKPNKPNIFIFFIDDLGYYDLGFRNENFDTPNIDKLAAAAVEFKETYVPTATCSPSRASLLTGKYAARLKIVRHIPKNILDKNTNAKKEFHLFTKDPGQIPSRNQLPLEEITIAEVLNTAGYKSYFSSGKWHLGGTNHSPTKQGFISLGDTDIHYHHQMYEPHYAKGKSKKREGQYLTDKLTDYVNNFLLNYKEKEPFFMYMPYYNVHGPHIGKNEYVEQYKAKGFDQAFSEYGAQVSSVDESVGVIMNTLEKTGLIDNTIVIFLSDQGGVFSNAPLRGGKKGGQTLCEGGSKVPFLIKFPGQKSHSVIESPVSTMDLFPTLAEFAGANISDIEIDGKSLTPLLEGGSDMDREIYLYRAYEDQFAAVRKGNWKLIVNRQSGKLKYELYDLSKDISEINNLAFSNKTKRNELIKLVETWLDDVAIHEGIVKPAKSKKPTYY